MYNPADLKPGDIILCTGELHVVDIVGLLIQWATNNPFQHAALVGNGCLIEAVEPDVRTAPLDEYAECGWRYEVAGATPEQAQTAIAAAMSRIGQPYGIKALLEDGLRYILHVPLYRRLDPHDLVCSGLVAYSWQQAGITLTYEPLPSPASLSYSPLLVGPRPWQN
jgi:cell wall-associated NlpC family hydrolase